MVFTSQWNCEYMVGLCFGIKLHDLRPNDSLFELHCTLQRSRPDSQRRHCPCFTCDAVVLQYGKLSVMPWQDQVWLLACSVHHDVPGHSPMVGGCHILTGGSHQLSYSARAGEKSGTERRRPLAGWAYIRVVVPALVRTDLGINQ
jgi:hypothetical protein